MMAAANIKIPSFFIIASAGWNCQERTLANVEKFDKIFARRKKGRPRKADPST